MQTILGSGGVIGKELAKALKDYTEEIRLVSRNPKKVNETDQLLALDLLDAKNVEKAVKGSSVVYVTIGFPYSYKSWKENWPEFTKNVINACMAHNCKLVFFDNVYMYDPEYMGNMTEETPVKPVSKKGEVRAETSKMIMDKIEEGKLTALIARSADFYGPGIENKHGFLTDSVFNPLSKGKTATWIGPSKFKHSFTYTIDAAKAVALLGNTDDAYNQIWHLPTAQNPLTGKEWIEAIAKELGTKPKYNEVSKFIIKMLGIFIPFLREVPEMLYQYDRDYVFNSDKFTKRFGIQATDYFIGIKEIVKKDYKR